MIKYTLVIAFFSLLFGTELFAQELDIEVKVIASSEITNNSDVLVTLKNGSSPFKVYLFDKKRPSWKNGKPVQSIIIKSGNEGIIKNVADGAYYVLVEDDDKNAGLKSVVIQSEHN